MQDTDVLRGYMQCNQDVRRRKDLYQRKREESRP